MGVDECWSAFCAAQGGFAYTYAAYRHYRQHNWVCTSAGVWLCVAIVSIP